MDLERFFHRSVEWGDGTAGVCVLALLAFFSPASQAQLAQQRPDAGTVIQEMKKPAAPLPGGEVLPRAPEPKPALGAPGLKVNVTAFRISGNTLFSEAVLLQTVTEFVGKEQDIDGLNDAATKVRAYYRERGYFLVQAYLPQQEIREGVVEIAVIEARLGKVELNFKQGTRFSEGLVRGIIEQHLKEGDLITEASLETPLLLLNDFPNAVVNSEIRPSQTLGAADLKVNVSDSGTLVTGQVGLDNFGNRFTGAWRGSFSMSVNNPLAIGDQLAFSAITTDEQMGIYRAAYTVPVLYWGTRLSVSYTSFHYQLGKSEFHSLQAHGVGGITSVSAFHPIIRTRGGNLIAQFIYTDKRLDDRVDTQQFRIEDRKITTSQLGLIGDFRDGVLGGGLNAFTFTLTEGNVLISPANILATDQGAQGLKTAGRFAKHNFEFRRLQKITGDASLLLALSGQMASKNLTSAEKFALGGINGVRAYPTSEALGDTGWVFQGEMRYLVPGAKFAGGDVTLSGFYDQGWVRVNENKFDTDVTNNRRISGYGLGASLGRDSDFLLSATAAWRNESERPISDTATRVPRIWVQAIKWF